MERRLYGGQTLLVEVAIWMPEDRALVGHFECLQAFRLLKERSGGSLDGVACPA
jgi:hypothetical protein